MTSGLRIVVASSGLGHVARGIEAWAADLAAALLSRGESVTLFKGGGQTEKNYERVLNCWQRDRSPVSNWWFPTRLLWRFGYGSPSMAEQTTFAKSLIRDLRKSPVDIVHVQDPHVALRVQESGLAKVILAHGTEEPPEFLKKIDYVQHLAPWHLEQAKATGLGNLSGQQFPTSLTARTFSPGNSPELRQDLGIPGDARVVLCVAAIKRHHKRIDYLLSEVASHNNAYLIVAGGWESETDSLIEVGKKSLGERVRFLVRFPRERMPSLYRAANVFVLPSLFEMMPIALVEACASGLPCITHDHPVMRWMTGPGGIGIDMARPGALAAALRSVPDIGAAAREHCVAYFNTDAIVDRIVEYYRQVMTK